VPPHATRRHQQTLSDRLLRLFHQTPMVQWIPAHSEGPSFNKVPSLAPRRLCKRFHPANGCSSTPGRKNNASYWNHIRMLIGTEFTTSQAPVVSAPDSTINILGGVDACPMKSRRIIMNTDRLTVPLIYLGWVQHKVKTACTLHNALSFRCNLVAHLHQWATQNQ
jgi:hypothetical protein